MKKRKIIPILATALIMSGCAKVSTDSTGKPVAAQESAISFSSYDELIGKIRTELNKKIAGEEYDLTDIAFSSVIGLANEADIGRFGYKMMDIDGDGADELILGEDGPEAESESCDSIIYDMYTIKDGKVCRVLEGWDRNRYYLCENGAIANESFGYSFESIWYFYRYHGGELNLLEGLYSGIYSNHKGHMYYKYGDAESEVTDSTVKMYSFDSFDFGKYKYRKIEYIPIIEKVDGTACVNTAGDYSQEVSQIEDEENENNSDYKIYKNIIEDIRNRIEIDNPEPYKRDSDNGYSQDLLSSIDGCVLYGRSEGMAHLHKLGYLQEDIDGDGTDELLVASVDSEGKLSDDKSLICMFTIKNGVPCSIFDKGERDEWQLCEDSIIKFEYFYASPSYGTEYYKYEKGNMELIEGIHGIFDFDELEFGDYYVDSDWNEGNKLTEEESDKIRDKFESRYKKQKLQFHLIKEYK